MKPEPTDEEIMDCMRLHLTNVRFVEDQIYFYATVHADNSHAVAVYFHKGKGKVCFAPSIGEVIPHTKYEQSKVEQFINSQTSDGNLI